MHEAVEFDSPTETTTIDLRELLSKCLPNSFNTMPKFQYNGQKPRSIEVEE